MAIVVEGVRPAYRACHGRVSISVTRAAYPTSGLGRSARSPAGRETGAPEMVTRLSVGLRHMVPGTVATRPCGSGDLSPPGAATRLSTRHGATCQQQHPPRGATEYPEKIDAAVLKIAGVVVLGAIMSILVTSPSSTSRCARCSRTSRPTGSARLLHRRVDRSTGLHTSRSPRSSPSRAGPPTASAPSAST